MRPASPLAAQLARAAAAAMVSPVAAHRLRVGEMGGETGQGGGGQGAAAVAGRGAAAAGQGAAVSNAAAARGAAGLPEAADGAAVTVVADGAKSQKKRRL